MRLTYWYAERLDSDDCYSIIAKTKKHCLTLVETHFYGKFASPVKKVIVYDDAFDLLSIVGGEDGGKSAGDVQGNKSIVTRFQALTVTIDSTQKQRKSKPCQPFLKSSKLTPSFGTSSVI